jgi:hypothetical protein
LDRTIGDHLVGVHVGLRAGTPLKYDQWKLTVPTAVDHLLCGAHDRVDFFFGMAVFPVGQGRAFFQDAERADDWPAPPETVDSDGKVLVGPLGLRAPQMIGRNLDVP